MNYAPSGWVGVQAVIALPVLAMLAFMPLVPESPKWLLLIRGRAEEAKETMTLLRPEGYDVDAEVRHA